MAPGRTAVLAPAPLFGDVARALAERGLGAGRPPRPQGDGLSAPLVLLPADEANGLEFDAVVVVEPALIAAGEAVGRRGPAVRHHQGLRTLYVALTRPTRRLAVVHSVAAAGRALASADRRGPSSPAPPTRMLAPKGRWSS